MDTVRHLAQRGARFYVPLGIGAHLERWGVAPAQIEELEWWQERSVKENVRIVCTPTRHYSGRGWDNRGTTLWSSWSVVGPQHRFFYSGDTGYAKVFKEIGARFGPFDIAFVKIGAYGPGEAWTDIHMPPEQAVQVHRDVCAASACFRSTGRRSISRTTIGMSRYGGRWPKLRAWGSSW